MSKQEFAKLQSCVLKVDMQCQCDGCKNKVKKLLPKVDGVSSTNVDAEQGKVTVTGNVNPATLINKLSKSGKACSLWVSQKGTNNIQHQFNNQFKNSQIDAQKSSKDNESQKGHGQQKGGGGGQQVQHMPSSMKGMGGKNDSKHATFVKKRGGRGGAGYVVKKGKGGSNEKQGGKDKNGGKGGLMGFLGFGKKSKKGGGIDDTDNSGTANGKGGGGGGSNNGGGVRY